MDPKTLLNRVEKLEKQILHMNNNDVKTKYQVIGLFRELKKVINFRIPENPIDIEEGGKYFQCPKCKTHFENVLDYTVEDVLVCPQCGQLFKEEGNDLDKNNS